MSGFAESIVKLSIHVLGGLTIHNQISKGLFQNSIGCLCIGFILILDCKGRSCIWSHYYLVPDFQGKESNLFWVSREDKLSSKLMGTFNIPHFIHSHTIPLPDALLKMLYIIENMLFIQFRFRHHNKIRV